MRHEEKFICSQRQLELAHQRLKAVLPYDRHQEGEDYMIRSLYLDTADDRLYRESVDGVDRRRKYRIRFYNMCTDRFRLERKDTVGRMKQKYSATVAVDDVEGFVAGGRLPESGNDLIREVNTMMMAEGLHPIAIVQYRRTAFTYPVGNVRITIDRDISCTWRTDDFLDPHALVFPVMPEGKHILEVKYDGILPGFIASVLDTGNLTQVSFSKYAYARSVITGNGRREDGYEF